MMDMSFNKKRTKWIIRRWPFTAGWIMVAVCTLADIFIINRPDYLITLIPFVIFLWGAMRIKPKKQVG